MVGALKVRQCSVATDANGDVQLQLIHDCGVEMDETYIGGKPRRKNRRSDDPPRGQGITAKEPVVGALERGGRVKARTVERTELTGAGL